MKSAKDYLDSANASVPRLSAEEAIERVKAGNSIVVDVRDSAAITESGTIAGALRIPRGFIEFAADSETPFHNDAMKKDADILSENKVLSLYNRALRWPFGRRLFSMYGARYAPYFKTISPLISVLEPNRCEILITKRRRVQNHIGTLHVIAIANGLEMAMGFMAEASIPKHLRWIPKGMQLDYPNKADTDIRCTASVPADAWQPGDLAVKVEATNTAGKTVVHGTIMLWISEKPARD